MNEYVIITDVASALPQNMADELGVSVLPMGVSLGSETFMHYADAREMSFKEFYTRVRAGEGASTSAVNPSDWSGVMEAILQSGKDILVIAFSSALSSTYENAGRAASEQLERYPNGKIRVVDSKCADFGEGLLIYLACKWRDEGLSLDELAGKVENSKLNICHWFTVDDLMHLRRGGRVSTTTALVGSALGIKPVMHVDNEGALISVGKTRGRKKSLIALVDKMEESAIAPESQVIFLSDGDCREDSDIVAAEIRKRFGDVEIKRATINPVIGAHSGPGTVALFFVGTQR